MVKRQCLINKIVLLHMHLTVSALRVKESIPNPDPELNPRRLSCYSSSLPTQPPDHYRLWRGLKC